MREGTSLEQGELKSDQIKKEIYSDNLTINKKDLQLNENKKKIMNYKNNEINYNNNVKDDLLSNNNNEDVNVIEDVFFNDMQTECQAAQTLLIDTFPLSWQNIPLMTNNSHPGKLFEINFDNFSHKNNIFDNVDLNNKNNSDDNKSNNIVSHMSLTFNKSNDEQKEHSLKKDYESTYSRENASTIIQTVINKKENIENVHEKIIQISEEDEKNIIDKRKHFIVNNKNKEIIFNFIRNPIRDMTLNERLNLLKKINTNQTSKREKNLLNNNSRVLDVPQQETVKTEENNKKILKNKEVNVNHNNLILPFTETIYIYDTSQEENKPKSALNFNVKIKCEEKNITLELKSIHVNNSIKFIKEIIKHMLYKQTNIRTIKSMILFIKENKMEDNKKIKDFYDDLINEKEVICQIEYLNLNIRTKHIKKECNDNNNS